MSASEQSYNDVIIIGAGPTGLAAAVYAAREGLDVLVLDKSIVGGLAAITDVIDNYPGFNEGISGMELAERLEKQAKRFGAKIRTGVTVTGLESGSDRLVVKTEQGDLEAAGILVATGSTYRTLDIPGEAEQIGRGVHFCATCDGPLYRGRELVVIGGGNSAVQETIFLARFASSITMLVRGSELKASEVIADQVRALPNVTIIYDTSATSIAVGDDRKKAIATVNNLTGQVGAIAADGIFVFVGLLANTQPFTQLMDHDERHFLKTDLAYRSNIPGVFVAGDVRSGSTWQIASAVGEGVSAALALRTYLDARNHAEKQ